MPSSIRTNVAALSARGSLVRNSADLAKTTQQLASGKRINSAADDAAGLAISSLMSAKLASIKQNQDNIAQGMSMAKIVDGALGDQASILTRLVSLAIQSANDTISDAQRGATIQPEVVALLAQFNKIGMSAEFNGVQLLAGIAANPGTAAERQEAAGLAAARAARDEGGNNAAIDAAVNTAVGIQGGDGARQGAVRVIPEVAAIRERIGAGAINGAARARIAARAAEAALAVKVNIQSGTDNSVNSRLTINIAQSLAANFGINAINLATKAGSQAAITAVNTAIANMAGRRAQIGAVISQFAQAMESTLTNEISTEEALGQITDADIAAAVSSLAAQSVLVQAATEMLAQANKHPQMLLQLLRGG